MGLLKALVRSTSSNRRGGYIRIPSLEIDVARYAVLAVMGEVELAFDV